MRLGEKTIIFKENTNNWIRNREGRRSCESNIHPTTRKMQNQI